MKFFCAWLLVLLPFFSEAQNVDSLAVLQANWSTDTLQKGLVLKTFHFKENLFGANQFVSMLLVDEKAADARIAVGAEPKELITTSAFAEKTGALAAVNGTFFDVKNGGSTGFVRSGGRTINETRIEKGKRSRRQQAALLMNGHKTRLKKQKQKKPFENSLKAPDVMISGPALLYHNQPEQLDTTAFTLNRHPRTAVGINKRRIMLLTVDGRSPESAGMSLPELQKLMQWLGNRDAINLDGGGSTTLWVKGQPDGGVVNHPCDNKKFDHFGQRKVANVLLVLPD